MSEKLNAILAAARLHTDEGIAPNVDEWNIAKTWPREAFDKAGAAGLMGLYAPEEFDGQGLLFLRAFRSMSSLDWAMVPMPLRFQCTIFVPLRAVDMEQKHLKRHGEPR